MRHNSIAGDQALLKKLNRMALLNGIRERPGVSRAELAKALNLAKPTVSQLIQELSEEGWIVLGSQEVSGIGRPSQPLSFNHDRLALIGAELTPHTMHVLVINPRGDVLQEVHHPHQRGTPGEVLSELYGLLKEAHTFAQQQDRKVIGAGVGLPGPVDPQGNLLLYAPNLDWSSVPVRSYLEGCMRQDGLVLPLALDNEANMAAMSEYMFGDLASLQDLIYLSVGEGLGSGFILRKDILHGKGGYAGEIGHTTLQPEQGRRCTCGKTGCAETLISVRAISLTLFGHEQATLSEIEAALQDGHPQAFNALHSFSRYLGILLSNLLTTFNPSKVVLGGPLMDLAPRFWETLLGEVRTRTHPGLYTDQVIVRCRFGASASAMGAAGTALQNALQVMPDPV